jgi:hypothetical protein
MEFVVAEGLTVEEDWVGNKPGEDTDCGGFAIRF